MVEQLWGEDDVGNQRGGSGKGERGLKGGNGGRGDGLSEKKAGIALKFQLSQKHIGGCFKPCQC